MNTNPNPNTVNFTLTAEDGSTTTWSNVPIAQSEEVGLALVRTCGIPDIFTASDGSDISAVYKPVFETMLALLNLV